MNEIKLFPGKLFWSIFIKKFLSFFVSFKVLIVIGATVLLVKRYIADSVWSTVVISITLGRVVVEGAYHSGYSRKTDENQNVGDHISPLGE